MYYIRYNTGAGDVSAETLGDAKRLADKGVTCTQRDIDICDKNGERKLA